MSARAGVVGWDENEQREKCVGVARFRSGEFIPGPAMPSSQPGILFCAVCVSPHSAKPNPLFHSPTHPPFLQCQFPSGEVLSACPELPQPPGARQLHQLAHHLVSDARTVVEVGAEDAVCLVGWGVGVWQEEQQRQMLLWHEHNVLNTSGWWPGSL